MKKYIILAVLLMTIDGFSQETKPKKDFRFEPLFRVSVIYPIQFGNHSLADAHRSNPGFEYSMSFFNYKNFRLAAGFDRMRYSVENKQLVGNFPNSNYTSIFGDVSYEFAKQKKLSFLADAGFGYANVQQANGADFFGSQEGTEWRIGLFADYRVAKYFSLFVGAHYIASDLKMETSPEYIDYYGKATQIQLTLGLKIN